MDNIIAYLDARPVATGLAGAGAGIGSVVLNYMKILGDVAGPLTVLFGCVSAFFAMLLVIHKFINRNKKK